MMAIFEMSAIVVIIFCVTTLLILAVGAVMTLHAGKMVTCRRCGTKHYAGKVCYCYYSEHL